MPKKKIGRNDRCPCNSGQKYKKCCMNKIMRSPYPGEVLSPEVLHAIKQHEAQNAQRNLQQGLGRPTVSFESNGHRIVTVGNTIFSRDKWKTFHDFLFDYIKTVLGPEWGDTEIKKSPQERHPILRWYHDLCMYQQSAPKNEKGIYSGQMTGAISAYLHLAYHLFLLAHNVELQKRFIDKLKNSDHFYGAYYELFVAASFIRAGFDLELEDDTDHTTKHCEFNATHRKSGQQFSVEAKSKGDAVNNSNPDKNIKVETKLKNALQKRAAYKRVVFIDINVPDVSKGDDEIGCLKEAMAQIRRSETTLKFGKYPAPEAYVFVTNMPYHHHPNSQDFRVALLAEGFKIPEFKLGASFPSLIEAVDARDKHIAMHTLIKSMQEQQVPSTFDGEIPDLEFNDIGRPRLLIGGTYLIPNSDGVNVPGVLEDAIVMQHEKMVHGTYRLHDGTRIHARCPITDIEFAAYQKHPDTFFGVHKQTSHQIKDPIGWFDFFYESYQNVSREQVLEFMANAPNFDKLKDLTQPQLARIYCEQHAYLMMRPT